MSLLLAVDCILVNSVVTCDSWFLGFVFVDLLSGCGISGGCLIVICDCFCLFVGVCDFCGYVLVMVMWFISWYVCVFAVWQVLVLCGFGLRLVVIWL